MKLRETTARDLRRVAEAWQRLAKRREEGGRSDELNAQARELGMGVLDALDDYRLAVNLMAFTQGPLRVAFMERYEDQIREDGDRMILEAYDDPRKRSWAALQAAQTGRVIILDDEDFWVFQEPETMLELLRFMADHGASPAQLTVAVPLSDFEDSHVHAKNTHTLYAEPEAEKEEVAGGPYL